jgi:transcriptional regulator with XRE-family HTH domain
MPSPSLTPNQIVAWNLKRARALRNWTQEEAGYRLEPYLGERWSRATVSAIERSVEGPRVRQFTADEIYALARAFEVPISYFLCPPAWADEVGHPDSQMTSLAGDYLDMVFDVGADAGEWLLRDVFPAAGAAPSRLERWGAHFAAMTKHL